MEKYMFICIGTNKLISDSLGPKVGDILTDNFEKNNKVEVLGTMKTPIHYQNAPIFLDYIKKLDNKIVLIDSALSNIGNIGEIYIQTGGLEIGKALGKTFYFPAHLSIKMIVGRQHKCNYTINYINKLANELATQITDIVYKVI